MARSRNGPEACGIEAQFGFDIRPYAERAEFAPGEVIFGEGGSAGRLIWLASGRAKATITQANGRVALSNFIDAPAFIGELELLGVQRRTDGVTAVTPCSGSVIDVAACRELLLGDPVFLRRLCVMLGRRCAENTRKLAGNQAYPLEVRLARLILAAARDGRYAEKHTETAEYLGVSYRHLLYVLAGLVRKGVLEKDGRAYRIADREALARLADR